MKFIVSACVIGFLALTMAAAPLPVGAAGDSSPPAPRAAADPNYEAAVKAIKAERYTVAIGLLEKVVASSPTNADAYNYLGYSFRKMSDFEGALRHYTKALAIEPGHRGANEYLGELYLKMGELAKAEDRLKTLDSLCFFGCEELDMLKASIEAYKSGKTGASIY